jgi:hypothetical protein
MANPESAEWIVSDTSEGAQQSPRWSRDSRELFFMTRSGNLMSVPVTPGSGFSWGTPRVVLTAKQLSLGDVADGGELLPGREIPHCPIGRWREEGNGANQRRAECIRAVARINTPAMNAVYIVMHLQKMLESLTVLTVR